ncbi:hypothetical protein [Thomasclavelia ramosa]|jgi:hypothetical protein|nr:hypothetical protein [Thomasclavelia ramosa]
MDLNYEKLLKSHITELLKEVHNTRVLKLIIKCLVQARQETD